MSVFGSVDTSKLIGCEFDSLNYEQHLALAGKWVATELYTPKTIPVRKIEAIADSPAGCIQALQSRGLVPTGFEFEVMSGPQ